MRIAEQSLYLETSRENGPVSQRVRFGSALSRFCCCSMRIHVLGSGLQSASMTSCTCTSHSSARPAIGLHVTYSTVVDLLAHGMCHDILRSKDSSSVIVERADRSVRECCISIMPLRLAVLFRSKFYRVEALEIPGKLALMKTSRC